MSISGVRNPNLFFFEKIVETYNDDAKSFFHRQQNNTCKSQ